MTIQSGSFWGLKTLATVNFDHPTEVKLRHFEHLLKGWHHGQGEVISSVAIGEAVELHRQLTGNLFFETDAFPGLNGEIQLTAYDASHCFEFTRARTGEWTFIHEEGWDEIVEIENLDFQQASEIVGSLRQRIWNTCTSWRDNIGIDTENAFEVWPLSLQIQTEESRSLQNLVSMQSPLQSVIISGTTPRMWPESRQSFGKFRVRYYPPPFRLNPRQVTEVTDAT